MASGICSPIFATQNLKLLFSKTKKPAYETSLSTILYFFPLLVLYLSFDGPKQNGSWKSGG
jgi:hypothetical protein